MPDLIPPFVRRSILASAVSLLGALSCGGDPGLRMTHGSGVRAYARERTGGSPGSDLATLRFAPGVCEGESLRPEYQRLDETSVMRFLERQHIDVRVERPRADLIYVYIGGAGSERPVRLRVAVLRNPDDAGRELHEALLQQGPGAWGVHRSNLAVLGPAGSAADDITFVGVTKLACWGVFTIADTDDAFVVPGAYTEL
jgi:hypothetical protein